MNSNIQAFTDLSVRSDNILVAEDDAVFRLLLETWLRQWGYRVTVAENGAAAWRELQSDHSPRLVLLDWMMPGLDGIEICRRVRGLQRELYSYIIVATAKTSKQDVINALDAGADDYVTKPVDHDELRARLQVGRRILQLQDELLRSRDQLRLQATHDALTGLWNRRSIIQALHDELARGQRTGSALGVLMLDLDDFKSINDTRGQQIGDAVLVEVAGRLAHAIRSYDKLGRYGGEEFLAVVPDCSDDMLGCIGERIRTRVAAKPIVTSGPQITVTVSVGGTVAEPELAPDCTLVIRNADRAMYLAKQAGKNCCVIGTQLIAAAPSHV